MIAVCVDHKIQQAREAKERTSGQERSQNLVCHVRQPNVQRAFVVPAQVHIDN